MKDEPDRWMSLALRLADGEPVEWEDEVGTITDADRDLLESFRALSEIARPQRGVDEPSGAPGGEHSGIDGAVGRFELLERVGRGSNGDVYRAKDRSLGRIVALKLLRPRGPIRDVLARADLLEEARRLASVKHPNVVTIYSAEKIDGREAIALEFIRGRTLSELVRDSGPFDEEAIRSAGIDLCRALSAVHAAGLLHLDVKPENVMREDSGRLVLMDFAPGAATPMCAAPELLRGEAPTARADVFGAGVVLFHAATGEYPFRARTLDELREAHRNGAIASLQRARPQLPAALAQAVDEAMSIDPAMRPATIADLQRALESTRPFRATAVPRARRRSLLLGTAAVAITVVVLVWRLGRELPDRNAAAPSTVAPRAESPPDTAPSIAPESFTVSAAFHRGSDPSARIRDGDAIAVGDSLAMTFAASESMYVYVVNEDETGAAFLLFPLPSLDRKNPLPPGRPAVLPGTRGGESSAWIVTSEGGREHLVVVASPRRLDALEDELFGMERAQAEREPEFATLGENAKRILRGIGGLARPNTPPPAVTRQGPPLLVELAEPLHDVPETTRGVWIRRIEFLNR